MAEILGGLYSLSNRAKRQLRDLINNPRAYIEQAVESPRDRLRGTSAKDVARRTFEPSREDVQSAMDWWNPSPLGAIAGVIKQKGGNWLTGSVEDALRGLKPERSEMLEVLRQAGPTAGVDVADLARKQSINQWIEGPLTKYVKSRMASPDDEVRRLAEQGVLHFEPQWGLTDRVVKAREAGGFPVEGLGKSELARNWETMSDRNLRRDLGRDLSAAERDALMGGKTVPPDTVVYSVRDRDSAADLGFPHLIDELSNALNPASGLPRNLQLTPEAMQNMSMEKAVRRVAEINAWRAAQKVEANRKLAEQASLVREYAENNPKGLRWVELNVPKDAKLPEGYSLRPEGSDGKLMGYRLLDQNGKAIAWGDTEAEAISKAYKGQLADQLKYEGDAMQICVGGQCYVDDVLSGRSRIFSLRDAKGEPHVTIETRPPSRKNMIMYKHELEQRGLDENEIQAMLEQAAEETLIRDTLPSIKQIKGKQNRAPNEEYIPFVQDFVRNSPLGSPWSEVGDLGNTGLRRVTEDNLRKTLGDYVTDDEWAQHMKSIGNFGEGYASGGSVTTPETLPASSVSGYNYFAPYGEAA